MLKLIKPNKEYYRQYKEMMDEWNMEGSRIAPWVLHLKYHNEKYQKNGYGTEAFSCRNKYCFDVLGLRRIENGYFPNNEKSRKMQMKLGYKDEGVRRKNFLCLATNEYVDECVTGLLKEEFIEWSDENEIL